ncbi:hypothetical protein V3G39_10320 [Dermatophilaceae bacterium Sec6.4]
MMTPVGTLFVILLVIGTSFSIGSSGSRAWPVLLWYVHPRCTWPPE